MVCEPGSFVCPLKKIQSDTKTINIKRIEAIASSPILNEVINTGMIRHPAPTINNSMRMRRIEYFKSGFKPAII